MKVVNRNKSREKRQRRVRARVFGTSERPRLNVFRGLRGVYAQLIDDAAGKTLAAVHSKDVSIKKAVAGERKGRVAVAYLAGRAIAEKAKKIGVTKAVFDRAGYKYHGRVAAVADGAREGGLAF